MKSKFFTCLAALLVSVPLMAQTKTITGVVKDAAGPVIGAQCESEVRGQISTIASIAREKGIPVIIGEYGATAARAEAEVAKQAACYVSACKENNMACFYWMLLSDGADRSVPKWTKPEVKDAIINASK